MKLHKDSRYINQPQGTIRNAINTVKDSKTNAITNERGFDEYSTVVDGKQPIGFCKVEDTVILFLTNKDRTGGDEIGRLVNGVYSVILKDNLSSGLLGFDLLTPIISKGYKNGNGEITVVWADGVNPLRILNVDDLPFTPLANWFPTIGDVELLRVFPIMDVPVISDISVDTGGTLLTGCYNVIFQYENTNGQVSNYTEPSRCVYVVQDNLDAGVERQYTGNEPEVTTDKAIDLALTDLDQKYDFLNIIVLQTSNGIVKAYKVDFIPITATTANFTINSLSNATELALEEVLTPKVDYSKVGIIELLNDSFFIADLETASDIRYQKYANNILIDYRTTEININDSSKHPAIYDIGGFMHGEVYALCIHLKLKNGLLTKGFHIPGRDPENNSLTLPANNADERVSTYDSDFGGLGDVLAYQVEETANHPTSARNMGFWKNKNETYPNIDEYNGSIDYSGASISGGRDLRNTNVKHHKMPSLREVWTNDYSADAAFGISKFSRLSIDVSNVVIPADIADQVQGYVISYIKRDYQNSIVIGQSLYQFEGETELSGVGQGDVIANIGNFRVDDVAANNNKIAVKKDYSKLRFHAFNLLKDKPQISPSFLINEFKLSFTLGNSVDDYFLIHSSDERKYNIDFTATGKNTVNATDTTSLLARVTDYQYVPSNIITNSYDNRRGEEYLQLTVNNGADMVDASDNNRLTSGNLILDTGSDNVIEEVFLSNLCQLLTDVYKGFYQNRKLALLNVYDKITGAGTYSETDIDGADSFIGVNGILRTCPLSAGEIRTDVGQNCMAIKQFLCESVANINLRYLDENDVQSFYSPKINRFDNDLLVDWLDLFDTGAERFAYYNDDFDVENENIISLPFNPYSETVTKYPNRIHKSIVTGRETQKLVLSFLNDDYKEMPKERGKIVGLNVLDNKLLIRLKESAYLTVPDQRIKLSESTAFLGNGQIFENEPQEIITSDNGVIGSHSKFSVITTKYGAIIPDPKAGRIFLLAGQAEEISDYGLRDMMLNGLDYTSEIKYWLEFDYTTQLYNTDKLRVLLDESVYTMYTTADFVVGEYIWLEDFTTFAEILAVRSNAGNIEIDTGHDYDSRSINDRMYYEKVAADDSFDNPYIGYGIVVGYDHENDRIIVTKKGEPVFFNPDLYKGLFLNNTTFLNALSDGDIVKWGKTYKKYNV